MKTAGQGKPSEMIKLDRTTEKKLNVGDKQLSNSKEDLVIAGRKTYFQQNASRAHYVTKLPLEMHFRP
jgi:hypothetical protein